MYKSGTVTPDRIVPGPGTTVCIYIDIKSFAYADSSARKSEVPPMVSASDRDPLASDLGPSTFVSRALSLRVSPPGLPPGLSPCVRSRGRAPTPSASTPNWADLAEMPRFYSLCWRRALCCCCSAEMFRFYSLCWRSTYLWCLKYLWCLLMLTRVFFGLLDPHGLAFFGTCLPARSDC